jgi:hypothetical protein
MTIGAYIFCIAIQSWVRSVICGSYMARVLVLLEHKKKAKM